MTVFSIPINLFLPTGAVRMALAYLRHPNIGFDITAFGHGTHHTANEECNPNHKPHKFHDLTENGYLPQGHSRSV